jgi:hypothetical protein
MAEIAAKSQLTGEKITDKWYRKELVRFKPDREYDFSPMPWWKS